MSYGQSLTSTLPTVGVTAGSTAATMINSYLDELRQVIEAKVTPAGMDMNADLSFLSSSANYSVIDLKKGAFARQSSLLAAASNPMAVFFGGTDGDLYVNDNAGRQIQVTTGGTLNASTTGGITGAGYGAGGVAVNWNAGTDYYELLDSATTYAGVLVDKIKITNGTAGVTINDTGAAADYTLTLPTAVPASTSLVLMSNAGALSTSLTPTITSLTTTSTIAASGLITANAGLTAAANQHVTVSGTGRFKHGNFDYQYGPLNIQGGAVTNTTNTATGAYALANSTVLIGYLSLDRLPVGARVRTITIGWYSGGATTPVYRFYRSTATNTTQVGADWGLPAGGAGNNFTDVSGALDYTIIATENYWIYLLAGHVNDRWKFITLTMDWP